MENKDEMTNLAIESAVVHSEIITLHSHLLKFVEEKLNNKLNNFTKEERAIVFGAIEMLLADTVYSIATYSQHDKEELVGALSYSMFEDVMKLIKLHAEQSLIKRH